MATRPEPAAGTDDVRRIPLQVVALLGTAGVATDGIPAVYDFGGMGAGHVLRRCSDGNYQEGVV